jgi:hypothetical protein
MNYRVRIKPGCRHGALRQHGPGDELIVSEVEKDAFADKFIVIDPVAEVGAEIVEAEIVEAEAEPVADPEPVAEIVEAEAEPAADPEPVAEIVEAEIVEAEAEPVADPEPVAEIVEDFDLKHASAEEILNAVSAGAISAADVLAFENGRSRPRKTILDALS